MKAEVRNHFLFIDDKQVRYIATPNVGSGENKLQYLIEHYTAAWNASGSISWLSSKESGVSAHLVIDRDGTVTQLAPFNKVCWHSGLSKWKDINGLNSYSIGIENCNSGLLSKRQDGYYSPDGHKVENYKEATNAHGIHGMWEVYPDAQVQSIAAVSKALKEHYNLLDILGHEDIAPIRKIDVGPAFPWSLIKGVDASNVVVKTTSSALNLRESPSTSAAIIKVLPEGTRVTVESEDNGWSKIKDGYVSSKYLVI